jgi:NAD(P)-dependent dehydrogenase (short-subunit alcohol dehydrogenase family)
MATSSDRVWFITGTSSGFGRALAEAALAGGDRVIATARKPESLEELVAIDPERVLAVPLDVTDQVQIEEAVLEGLKQFSRIDVVVNNAGYGSVGAVEEIDLADLRALFDTMYFGAVAVTQAVLPHLRERGSGAIVNMSSMGGQQSPAGFGAYCSAKFALEAISESLHAELEPLGIQVLIVEPGAFRTGFAGDRLHQSEAMPEYEATVGPNRQYLGDSDGTQPGDPKKAAEAVIAAIDADDAPLRLALGDDAVDGITGALDRRRADLEAWEPTSRSTSFA